MHRGARGEVETGAITTSGVLPPPGSRRRPTVRQLDRKIDLEEVSWSRPGVSAPDVDSSGRQPADTGHEGHVAAVEDPALEAEQEELSL